MITGLYITGITVASKLHKSFESYKIDLKTIEKDVKNKHLNVNLTDCSNLTSLVTAIPRFRGRAPGDYKNEQ